MLLTGPFLRGIGVSEVRLYLSGPEIINRRQPHGAFEFFFNGIHLGGATDVSLRLDP